jgi:translation initiation factor IF-3
MATTAAIDLAAEAGLDLVEVAPEATPPVARVMDYGKFKYDQSVKARETRRNTARNVVREMKFRPQIDDHDYVTKRGHIERFLRHGDKVKITVMFRGRQQSRPEMGRRLLERLASDLADIAVVETSATQFGRDMTLVLAPVKNGVITERAS